MVNRKGIIIYYNNDKFMKEIDNIINVTYISKKNKYIIGYCDEKRYEGYKSQILKLKGVNEISESLVDLEDYCFEENPTVKTVK